MKKLLNSKYISILRSFLIILAILKIISLVAIFFLPKTSVNFSPKAQSSLPYKNYKILNAFGLQNTEKTSSIKPTNKQIIAPNENEIMNAVKSDFFTLKAIYGNKKQGFIVFSDSNEPNANIILALYSSYQNYKLILIRQKSVILQKDGVNYELALSEERSKEYLIATSTHAQNTQEEVIRAVNKNDVLHYAKNFKDIWKNIAIKEIMQNGEITGFEIKSINSNSIFSQLGLRQGDIIKSVNNEPLTSYADAFRIYDNIANISNLKLEIIRNNEKKELEYEIF